MGVNGRMHKHCKCLAASCGQRIWYGSSRPYRVLSGPLPCSSGEDMVGLQPLWRPHSSHLHRQVDHHPYPPPAESLLGWPIVSHHLQHRDEYPGGLNQSFAQCCAHLGYSFNSVPGKINLLQYADWVVVVPSLACRPTFLSVLGLPTKPPLGGPTIPTSHSVASPSPTWVTPPSGSWEHQWPFTPPQMRPGNTSSPSCRWCYRGLMTPPSWGPQ